MDRVKRYREIIHQLLDEYRQLYAGQPASGVETAVIADDTHGEYMLMRVGWREDTRVRRPAFYLRLKGDKVWIEEDWTPDGVATELVAAGVPHEDIVLAFQPPELRHLTEFAAA
jgi:XisI protein